VTSASWLQTWPRKFSFALVAVAAAGLLRYGLDIALGFTQPFILFYPTITLIALLGGLGPGVFATLLSAGIAEYFFMEPLNSLVLKNPRDIVGLVLFGVMGLAISGVGELFRRRTYRLQEFETAVEGLEEMITVIDRDYRYVMANRAFLKYREMKREELLGRRIADVLNPGMFETTLKNKLDECFQGKIVQFEMRYPCASRGERDLFISYFPMEGPGGVDRVTSVLQDITDRKEAERSLRLFRTLIDHSNDAVEVIDPETLRFLDVNEKACTDLGYTREELLSLTVYDIDPNADKSCHSAALEKLMALGFEVKETVHRRKDGTIFPVETSLKYVSLDRNYVVAVTRDISDRKLAEDTLRRSEQRYRLLFEKNVAGVSISNLDGEILECNDAGARILGYNTAEEIRGRRTTEFYFDLAERQPLLGQLKREGSVCSQEIQLRRKDGTPVWLLFNTAALPGEDEGTPLVQATSFDITERKRAEEALRRREEDYRRFVAQSSEGIYREEMETPVPIDLTEDELVQRILFDSYVGECNDAMARMYGFTSGQDLTGKRVSEMLVADDPRNAEMIREFIRSGFNVVERESHEVDIHGNPKVFRNSMIGIVEGGKLVRTWGIRRDVTEQVRLETARSRAEKALQVSETHFRLLVEQATDGIFIADAQGKCMDVNSAGAEMLGYTREEMMQLSIADVIAEQDVSRIAEEVARFAGGVYGSE